MDIFDIMDKMVGTYLYDFYFLDSGVAIILLAGKEDENIYKINIYGQWRVIDENASRIIGGILEYTGYDYEDRGNDCKLVENYFDKLKKNEVKVTNCKVSPYGDLAIEFSNEQRLEVFSATSENRQVWTIEVVKDGISKSC